MKKTQEQRVLERLQQADGSWICGEVFLREMLLSQYHSRIFGLIKKGHKIEASEFLSGHGFKSYRLITHPEQRKLI